MARPASRLHTEVVDALAQAGHSVRDISYHTGHPKSTVWDYLQSRDSERQSIRELQDESRLRDELYLNLALAMSIQRNELRAELDGITTTDGEPRKVRPGVLMSANATVGTLLDKLRLVEGKSTQNVGVLMQSLKSADQLAEREYKEINDLSQAEEKE